MLAYGGLGLIIGPREGELSLNCCFKVVVRAVDARDRIATVVLVSHVFVLKIYMYNLEALVVLIDAVSLMSRLRMMLCSHG